MCFSMSRSPVNSGLMTEEARRGTNSPILQNQGVPNGLEREKDRRNNNNHKVFILVLMCKFITVSAYRKMTK